jgi:hypothetical protein
MSRRSEWGAAREKMVDHSLKAKGVEQRERVPDICCGKCKNFSENAYVSDGSGFCGILREGSNIETEDYLLEGKVSLRAVFNMDAGKCKYYEQMEMIDTDTTECADPAFMRAARQMAKKQ